MFVLRNLMLATADVLDMALGLFTFVIVARALISWVSPDPFNPIVQFLYKVTEPLLAPVRRRIPMGGFDLSPIVVIFAIVFLRRALVASIRQVALGL